MDKGLKLRFSLSALMLLFIVSSVRAQVIDEIVAVIGNEIVLYSDIQIQKSQIRLKDLRVA